jgi:hypothetical protein
MNTHRAWVKFPLTNPTNHRNSPQIDPRPAESALKHARLTGQGCAIPRNLAQDKKEMSR